MWAVSPSLSGDTWTCIWFRPSCQECESVLRLLPPLVCLKRVQGEYPRIVHSSGLYLGVWQVFYVCCLLKLRWRSKNHFGSSLIRCEGQGVVEWGVCCLEVKGLILALVRAKEVKQCYCLRRCWEAKFRFYWEASHQLESSSYCPFVDHSYLGKLCVEPHYQLHFQFLQSSNYDSFRKWAFHFESVFSRHYFVIRPRFHSLSYCCS